LSDPEETQDTPPGSSEKIAGREGETVWAPTPPPEIKLPGTAYHVILKISRPVIKKA